MFEIIKDKCNNNSNNTRNAAKTAMHIDVGKR